MPMRLSEISVLIVDDNANMQNIIRELLFGLGIKQVFRAGDGAEALDVLSQKPVDVVICELEMAPIDGLEFLGFLRRSSDSPAAKVPVVILTGETRRTRIEAARDAGANEFIVKPVSARTLLQRIETVLGRPRDFVSTTAFVGPDRRRKRSDELLSEDRRSDSTMNTIEVE